MRIVGYARVSTGDQTTLSQVDQLRRNGGCSEVFEESASGGQRHRPVLDKLLKGLRRGDVLVIVRLDRLARSLAHLIEIGNDLRDRGVGFRCLEQQIDTTTPNGNLVFQILGAVGEFERSLIRERTIAGLASARARGRVGGNPKLRLGDRETIRRAATKRRAAYADGVIKAAGDLLSIVRASRPRLTWDDVVALLAARGIERRQGVPWTRDTLIRAVKHLVRDGLAEAELLQRVPARPVDSHIVTLVAGIHNSLPKPTLARVAAELEAMKVMTPRGSRRWAQSTVKNMLARARSEELLNKPDDP